MFVLLDGNGLTHCLWHVINSSITKGKHPAYNFGDTPDPAEVNNMFMERLTKLKHHLDMRYRLKRCEDVGEIKYICVFDSMSQCFRKGIDPVYKSDRKTDPGVYDAVDFCRSSLDNADDWRSLVAPSTYEADDMIASVAAQTDERVIIHSVDKDFHQCFANGRVEIIKRSGVHEEEISNGDVGTAFQMDWFRARDFRRLFGFSPKRWIDYQCLVGDSADCVKGAKGIGGKTATRLLRTNDCELEEIDEGELTKSQQKHWPDFLRRLDDLRDILTLRKDLQWQS